MNCSSPSRHKPITASVLMILVWLHVQEFYISESVLE